ncbi:hypothetical protein GEMRC1_003657 [Eukaryota sp. GEM-RC1]
MQLLHYNVRFTVLAVLLTLLWVSHAKEATCSPSILPSSGGELVCQIPMQQTTSVDSVVCSIKGQTFPALLLNSTLIKCSITSNPTSSPVFVIVSDHGTFMEYWTTSLLHIVESPLPVSSYLSALYSDAIQVVFPATSVPIGDVSCRLGCIATGDVVTGSYSRHSDHVQISCPIPNPLYHLSFFDFSDLSAKICVDVYINNTIVSDNIFIKLFELSHAFPSSLSMTGGVVSLSGIGLDNLFQNDLLQASLSIDSDLLRLQPLPNAKSSSFVFPAMVSIGVGSLCVSTKNDVLMDQSCVKFEISIPDSDQFHLNTNHTQSLSFNLSTLTELYLQSSSFLLSSSSLLAGTFNPPIGTNLSLYDEVTYQPPLSGPDIREEVVCEVYLYGKNVVNHSLLIESRNGSPYHNQIELIATIQEVMNLDLSQFVFDPENDPLSLIDLFYDPNFVTVNQSNLNFHSISLRFSPSVFPLPKVEVIAVVTDGYSHSNVSIMVTFTYDDFPISIELKVVFDSDDFINIVFSLSDDLHLGCVFTRDGIVIQSDLIPSSSGGSCHSPKLEGEWTFRLQTHDHLIQSQSDMIDVITVISVDYSCDFPCFLISMSFDFLQYFQSLHPFCSVGSHNLTAITLVNQTDSIIIDCFSESDFSTVNPVSFPNSSVSLCFGNQSIHCKSVSHFESFKSVPSTDINFTAIRNRCNQLIFPDCTHAIKVINQPSFGRLFYIDQDCQYPVYRSKSNLTDDGCELFYEPFRQLQMNQSWPIDTIFEFEYQSIFSDGAVSTSAAYSASIKTINQNPSVKNMTVTVEFDRYSIIKPTYFDPDRDPISIKSITTSSIQSFTISSCQDPTIIYVPFHFHCGLAAETLSFVLTDGFDDVVGQIQFNFETEFSVNMTQNIKIVTSSTQDISFKGTGFYLSDSFVCFFNGLQTTGLVKSCSELICPIPNILNVSEVSLTVVALNNQSKSIGPVQVYVLNLSVLGFNSFEVTGLELLSLDNLDFDCLIRFDDSSTFPLPAVFDGRNRFELNFSDQLADLSSFNFSIDLKLTNLFNNNVSFSTSSLPTSPLLFSLLRFQIPSALVFSSKSFSLLNLSDNRPFVLSFWIQSSSTSSSQLLLSSFSHTCDVDIGGFSLSLNSKGMNDRRLVLNVISNDGDCLKISSNDYVFPLHRWVFMVVSVQNDPQSDYKLISILINDVEVINFLVDMKLAQTNYSFGYFHQKVFCRFDFQSFCRNCIKFSNFGQLAR